MTFIVKECLLVALLILRVNADKMSSSNRQVAPTTQRDGRFRQCKGEGLGVPGEGGAVVVVAVVDCGLKVEPLDGSAEATRLSPNHAAQHATPRPVSQSVSQCMQSSDTPATGSPVGPAGAPGRAGKCWGASMG